jgi:hypothetical protein
MIEVLSRDRRFAWNQTDKRRVSSIVRVRGGNLLPAVFNTESHAASSALGLRRARLSRRRDNLHERFEVKKINHQEAYSLDGACANMAEEYCSRLRRAEIDAYRPVAGRLSAPPRELAVRRNNPVVVTAS